MVSNTDFAIVTPSYHADFEACRLLVESVERFVAPDIRHYLIIPRSDRQLFEPLASERTILKYQDDCLPNWLFKVPFSNKWYFNLKGFPVRGWIRQQIVKLSIGEFLPEANYLIVDSDTFFVRPFDLNEVIKDGKLSFFCETLQRPIPHLHQWQQSSAKLLNVSNFQTTSDIYVLPFIFWKKTVLQELYKRLEMVHKKSWREVLCNPLRISEFTLYGVFLTEIMGIENGGHFRDSTKYILDQWGDTPLNEQSIQALKKKIEPHYFAVSISARTNTRMSLIRDTFGF